VGVPADCLVLVVDDYEDNRVMYAEYLAALGYRTLMANDGAEALAIAVARMPDVIVLDLSMPGMDGWEAATRLKADERTRGICIIALTGHAEARHYTKAKGAGCDYFLAKPCPPQDLAAHIEASLAER
jgi:two-component system cell cycle response regulator DivK